MWTLMLWKNLLSATSAGFTFPMLQVFENMCEECTIKVVLHTSVQFVVKASLTNLTFQDTLEFILKSPVAINAAKSSLTKRRNILVNLQKCLKIRTCSVQCAECIWIQKSVGDIICGNIPKIQPTYRPNRLQGLK